MRLCGDHVEHPWCGPRNMERLWVTTINWGSLDTCLCKGPRLIAYLLCAGPDIVHLKELGLTFGQVWFWGLTYYVMVGPLVAAGGLAVMLRERVVSAV